MGSKLKINNTKKVIRFISLWKINKIYKWTGSYKIDTYKIDSIYIGSFCVQ